VFSRGDTGQEIFAWPPCTQPTVRDGWVWRDFIRVWPVNGLHSVAPAFAQFREMAKAHPNCHIVATLTGRLETRDHFDTQLYGDTPHPIGFKWFVAQLLYRAMDHFEAVPISPPDIRQELEIWRRPWAERPEAGSRIGRSVPETVRDRPQP
jgi:hypothetical protein